MRQGSFSRRIVDAIKKIPAGRVATYGQIAMIAGNPRAARQVVRILHTSSEKEDLPWHRVVNRHGRIALRRGSGYEFQKRRLQEEGITFGKDDRIDFKKFLWEPVDVTTNQ